MKRSGKKLMLASLMSAALICSNMSFVYATEQAPAEVSESEPSQEAGAQDEVQPEAPEQEESQEQTVPESVTAPEQEDTDNTETSEQEESQEQTAPESAAQPETSEQEGTGEEDAGVDETELESESGTEEETEEASVEEILFVDKNGNELLPSSLVGQEYDLVAESYDGELNVIKKYAESEEYEANVIMDSYVDEDGNLVILISQGAPKEEETAVSLKLNASGVGDAPAVDGSFTGWDDIPASYEFNWNKPDAWVDGEHYTETNSTDVRHEMKLYSDGENVYLKVVFAREFKNGQVANGNDYQFWIDNQQMAAYQVEWPDGTSLSNSNAEPGTYQVDVRHRDSSWSYVLTDGAVAYYHVNEDNLNNELELKIPMSEFVKQNPNIDLDNYNMISFFTPNLMQDKISTAGASTGAVPFAAAAFLVVPVSYIVLKKKKEGELALA